MPVLLCVHLIKYHFRWLRTYQHPTPYHFKSGAAFLTCFDEASWQHGSVLNPKPTTSVPAESVGLCKDMLRFARSLYFRALLDTHTRPQASTGCHTPDTAPLGPRSESREARTAPANKTLGSATAVSAPLPPQAAGDRRPRIPATLRWCPVSQGIRIDPSPRGIRGSRVSETAYFEAETAAGNVDDHRVFNAVREALVRPW